MNIAERNRQALLQSEQAGANFVNQYVPAVGSSVSPYGDATKEALSKYNFIQRLFPSKEQKADIAGARELDQYNAGLARQAEQTQQQFQRDKPNAMGLAMRELQASDIDPAEGARIGRAMYGAENAEELAGAATMGGMSMNDPRFSEQAQKAEKQAMLEQKQGNMFRSNQIAAQEQALNPGAGYFGSGIDDYQTFQTIAQPLSEAFMAAETMSFMGDVVEQLTPDEISANGELKGELQAKSFQMLGRMQGLMENKASTLREGERKMIEEFQSNPESLIKGIFSRDEVTMGKLKTLENAFMREVENGLVGLDDTTKRFLTESALKRDVSTLRFKTPMGTIRKPKPPPPIEPQSITLSEQNRRRENGGVR